MTQTPDTSPKTVPCPFFDSLTIRARAAAHSANAVARAAAQADYERILAAMQPDPEALAALQEGEGP